jgi:hypothetical protein
MSGTPARTRSWPHPWRWAIVGALLLAAVAVAVASWQRFVTRRPLAQFETGQLRRQVEVLRLYAERRERPAFLPPGDAVLALREEFLQAVLDGSLPIRRSFADGKYEAVLDSASLRLEDGMGSVSLSGHGQRAGETDPARSVALDVRGYLERAGVDAEHGSLGLGLVFTDVRVRRLGLTPLNLVLLPVVRYFGGQKAEEWNRAFHTLAVPVRIDQRITIPEIAGDVSIASRSVPAAVRVAATTMLERRLAVSLELLPDSASGEAAGGGGSRAVSAGGGPGWQREMEYAGRPGRRVGAAGGSRAALERERARLAAEVRALARRDTLWQALAASDRDVCVVLPAGLVQRGGRRLAMHYLRDATLDFDPKVRAHIDEKIHVKLLGKDVGVGRIHGEVRVTHLEGRLQLAGLPELRLQPPDEIVLRIPALAAEGRGDLRLGLAWDPAVLTSVVCRGFAFEERVRGDVVPFGHTLTARVRFALADSEIVGVTRLQRDRVAIPAVPTPASLAKIKSVIEGEDKFMRCGLAIDVDEVMVSLEKLVRRGVKVRLPGKLFKPFRLPVRLEGEFAAGDYRVRAHAHDPELVMRPEYLRFGFQAGLDLEGPETPPARRPAGTTERDDGRGADTR